MTNPSNLTYIRKEWVLTTALLLAVITIPLPNTINSWALGLFIFISLLQMPVAQQLQRLKESRSWILPVCFFIWIGMTVLWDTSPHSSFKYIDSYLTFLAIPIVLTILPKFRWKVISRIMLAFIGMVTLICLVCLTKSYLEYKTNPDFRLFYYHYLSMQVGLNAIFLSSYCVASICWLIYFQFIDHRKAIRLRPAVTILWSAFLLFMIFLLSSKMMLALAILFILFLIIYLGYLKKRLLWASVALLLLAVSAGLAVSKLPYLSWRLQVTKLKMFEGTGDEQNGLAARLLMWKCAGELIEERPLLGHGLKGYKEELIQKYREHNFQIGVINKYHCHNQYLQTMLIAGFVGLALFISMLVVVFIKAVRNKQLLLILFLIHYIIASVVESTLEVQQELVFYWLFIFLLYYQPSLNADPDHPSPRLT